MDVTGDFKPQDIFSVTSTIIVITGGGSGIGLAMAAAAFKAGASKVYILGRREDKLSAAVDSLKGEGVIVPVVCDVTSQESIDSAVAFIDKDSAHIDVLINNAGRPSPFYDPTAAKTIEELRDGLLDAHLETQDVLQTNIASIIGVSSSFLPLLHKGNVKRGWSDSKLSEHSLNKQQIATSDVRTSQIITVSSITGFERHGLTGLAYSASKAAATHLGKVLATMLVPWNIRSNVIVPGLYPSEMTAFLSKDAIPISNTPAGRAGSFEDVAGIILYLMGRGGAYVNGCAMLTDGGRLSIESSSY
ncbi:hypothetical protein BJ166DRAFT_62740 [Pestalotiopsis sp. NC0098]|nr:hypothetical protein BJ166DRAFT_62740 [Pestalotiopsis sp. NC0098]